MTHVEAWKRFWGTKGECNRNAIVCDADVLEIRRAYDDAKARQRSRVDKEAWLVFDSLVDQLPISRSQALAIGRRSAWAHVED